MSMPAATTVRTERTEPSTCENCSSEQGVRNVVASTDGPELARMCRQCRKAFWRVSS